MKLKGTELAPTNKVKYLGIFMDSKMGWSHHIDYLVAKATKAMWACKSLYGKAWGLSPNMSKWIYTAIVRPRITYGAVVWCKALLNKTVVSKITKLQRLACLFMTSAMKTCPTAALEYLVGLAPLHIHITKVATISSMRLGNSSESYSWVNGRMSLLKNTPYMEQMVFISDVAQKILITNRNFDVVIPNRDYWESSEPHNDGSLDWYTDGSKMKSGVGAGIFGFNTKISISMGLCPTVFQAEI